MSKPNILIIFGILITSIIINSDVELFRDKTSLDIFYRDKFIQEPDKYGNNNKNKNQSHKKCLYNKKELLGRQYFHIISQAFKKPLDFSIYNNKSDVSINKNITNPRKWEIVKSGRTFLIRSFSPDPAKAPMLYLYANGDGTLGVTYFGGSENQLWKICQINNSKYVIISAKYGTYLSATNSGIIIMKNNGDVGSSEIWNLIGKGDRKIPKYPDKYKGKNIFYRSYTDYPNLSDKSINAKSAKELKKTVDKRHVWMKEFVNIWNGTYEFHNDESKVKKDIKIDIALAKPYTDTATGIVTIDGNKWDIISYGSNILYGKAVKRGTVYLEMLEQKIEGRQAVLLNVTIRSKTRNFIILKQ